MRRFKPGDPVVYRKHKYSACPGRHAVAVTPASNGDLYSYCVDKFWRVIDVREGKVVVRTRRGKRRTVAIDDPALRPASWWERFIYADRIPTPNAASSA